VATPAIAAIVGAGDEARIWPMHLEETDTPAWPAITVQVVSGRPEYDLSGPAGVAEVRIQIDCWSAERDSVDAYHEVRTLAEAVRAALSGFRGTVSGAEIQSCFLDNRRPLHDPSTLTIRESMDFLVAYTES
jgi:hypothetical protein